MSLLRRQLPVRSPLTLAAALAPLGRHDARPDAQQLLDAEYPGRGAVLTSSGTHALQLALALVRAQRGDAPIAVPAYACFDLATAALGAGVRVRLYDVDPRSLQPDLDSLAAAVGTDAAAVVVVHLYGVPVALPAVEEIAKRSGAVVIEDAAQGTGAAFDGAPLGGRGDLGVLSFGRGKGVTGGGGGALLVSEAFRAAAAALMDGAPETGGSRAVQAAKGLAQWSLARPAIYGIPSRLPFLRLGETIYHAPTPVAPMSATAARTLLRTWRLRDEETRRRRTNAERLQASLRLIAPSHVLPIAPSATPGWLRFPLLLPTDRAPDRALAASLGIVPAYPISLEKLGPFQPALLGATGGLAGARALAQRLWTLPTHGALAPQDLDAVAAWMRQALLNRP